MNPLKTFVPLFVLGNGMDRVLEFQPKGNPTFHVRKIPMDIKRTRDGLEDPNVNTCFKPSIIYVGINGVNRNPILVC